jgi:hypothetical protein
MTSLDQDRAAGSAVTSSAPPRVTSGPEGDRVFVEHLRTAGRLVDLDPTLEESLLASLDPRDSAAARRIDLLEAYYRAPGDEALARFRTRADRFFLHVDDGSRRAIDVIERLVALAPEIGSPHLERIGGLDGQLVLRSDDDLSPIDDDDEDAREDDSITVRGLVRAVNGLLERRNVPERFVEVLADGAREAYLAFDVSSAMRLLGAGLLPETSPDALMELGGW